MQQVWRNRVVEQRMVPVGELAEHPGNWRRHPPRQRRALGELLGSVGFAGAVIWNKRTGRLIDGHLRVETARDSGEKELPAVVVDVDEDEERLLLASYDPLGAMAEQDGEAFQALLDGIQEIGGIDNLLVALNAQAVSDDSLTDPNAEWQGMPEFEHGDKRAYRSIVVHFKDAESVDDFAVLIKQSITDKTRFVWFPEITIERYADKRWMAAPDAA